VIARHDFSCIIFCSFQHFCFAFNKQGRGSWDFLSRICIWKTDFNYLSFPVLWVVLLFFSLASLWAYEKQCQVGFCLLSPSKLILFFLLAYSIRCLQIDLSGINSSLGSAFWPFFLTIPLHLFILRIAWLPLHTSLNLTHGPYFWYHIPYCLSIGLW